MVKLTIIKSKYSLTGSWCICTRSFTLIGVGRSITFLRLSVTYLGQLVAKLRAFQQLIQPRPKVNWPKLELLAWPKAGCPWVGPELDWPMIIHSLSYLLLTSGWEVSPPPHVL